jgi:beta-N-acetylhexosaminidase
VAVSEVTRDSSLFLKPNSLTSSSTACKGRPYFVDRIGTELLRFCSIDVHCYYYPLETDKISRAPWFGAEEEGDAFMVRHAERIVCFMATALLCLQIVNGGFAGQAIPRTLDEEAEKWVNETLKQMSVDEKIGSVICATTSGRFIAEDTEAWQRLRSEVTDFHIGSYITYHGSALGTAWLTNKLQSLAKYPLLFAADMESGAGYEVPDATEFPSNMAVGATRNPEHAYLVGKITAIEARAMGIDQNYGPVADINNNPDNPIINIRSFGQDTALVAEMTRAYVRGSQENGLLATAKHFPGHGDTTLDSHSLMPVFKGDRERMNQIELVPFKAAIEEGVAGIMTAHIAYPQLEKDERLPATLSHRVLTDLLQGELGFKGLIVTDSMQMGGIVKYFGSEDATIQALQAGADVILCPADASQAFGWIKKAVNNGLITEARLDQSVRKLLRLKAMVGLHKNRMVDLAALETKVATKANYEAAKLVARDSVTLLRNANATLPLKPDAVQHPLVLALYDDLRGDHGQVFKERLEKRFSKATIMTLDPRSSPASYRDAYAAAIDADAIICGLCIKIQARKDTVELLPEQNELLATLAKGPTPVIVISFGNPYLIRRFPEVDAYLTTYGYSDVSQEAGVEAILGEFSPKGKLPISIPGLYDYGFGLSYN